MAWACKRIFEKAGTLAQENRGSPSAFVIVESDLGLQMPNALRPRDAVDLAGGN